MENNLYYFICVCYLFGSIPYAYIITKLFGYGDIRNIGSGNVGATNVLRTGKKSLAIIVLFLDVLKGYAPISILLILFSKEIPYNQIIFLSSLTVIGHIFPVWLKFKGGKGVATFLGLLLGINLITGIFFIIIWILTAFLTKYSSLASIISIIVVLIFSIFFSSNIEIIIIIFILGVLIIIKHLGNIKRLLSKSENKIKL